MDKYISIKKYIIFLIVGAILEIICFLVWLLKKKCRWKMENFRVWYFKICSSYWYCFNSVKYIFN